MFKCSKCGMCCRNIVGDRFSEYHNGDGICKYLDRESNLCTIYENRPHACRVDEIYETYFAGKGTGSKEKYYETYYKACEILREEAKKQYSNI